MEKFFSSWVKVAISPIIICVIINLRARKGLWIKFSPMRADGKNDKGFF